MSFGTVITQQAVPPVPVVQNVAGQVFSFATPVVVSSVENTANAGLLQKFLKGEPKALGTVQIMIGLFTFLCGLSWTFFWTASVSSGIVFWGSSIYISTGAVTIATEKRLIPSMVKGSLGMNVVSAVTSGIAVFMLCIDLSYPYICSSYSHYDGVSNSSYYSRCIPASSSVMFVVILIFNLLEFCISVSISAFGCKAVCGVKPTVIVVASNPCVPPV